MTNLIITIVSGFVSVILGIAYSILSSSISEIEEKYVSRTIINSFKEKKDQFKKSLQIGVFCIFIFIVLRYFIEFIGDINNNNNIRDMLTICFAAFVLITTILLIVEYFDFIDEIIIYKSPLELLKYFIEKEDSFNDEICFKAVEDILFYSLKNDDKELNRKALEFIYQSFYNRRNDNE